jgi:hypothetical protein
MKSLTVEDNDGNVVYKRYVLKRMNLGESITKSLDRERRVRGDTMKSASGNAAKDSVVKRVFYSYSFPAGMILTHSI